MLVLGIDAGAASGAPTIMCTANPLVVDIAPKRGIWLLLAFQISIQKNPAGIFQSPCRGFNVLNLAYYLSYSKDI
ncbi:MAG: hypothetical protein FWE42_05250 [Defluviitaleaceae bacterium]|nr:hypothetical protein [Defluviitaleaceae bacterium]